MAESKHTPTPWKLTYADGSGDQAGASTGNTLVGADDSAICFGGNSFGLTIGILKATDAAHIVKCVNSHEKLVKALRELAREVRQYDHGHSLRTIKALHDAETALREAGEEL